MKKKIIAVAAVILILLVLFLPIQHGTYRDGGTKDYGALTYRIVVWNRLTDGTDADGAAGEMHTYHKTCVYWLPDNFKSIDELWKTETDGNR